MSTQSPVPTASLSPKKNRNWFDITSTLLLPVILACAALWVPYKTHESDVFRQQNESKENKARIEFERETGFVKMMASQNEDERQLAVALISITPPKERDQQVNAVLTSLCSRKTDSNLKGLACDLTPTGQVAQRQPEPSQISGSGPTVYIQIAKEDQRADAERLQARLAQNDFRAVSIQFVQPPVATVHTYVRFFAASSALQAAKIADVMSALNYNAVGVQDFSSYTDKPLPSLEIWIGRSQEKI